MSDFFNGVFIVVIGVLVLYFIFGPLLALMDIPKRLEDIETAIKEISETLRRR